MHRIIVIALMLTAAISGFSQNSASSYELLHAKAAHECLNNSVAYVGEGPPYTTCWGTSDIGGQINAAVASIQQYKNKTGKVVIQTGTYTYSTPISMPYWVMLDGQFAVLVSNVTSGCSLIDGATIPDSPHYGWTFNNGGIKDIGLFSAGSKAPYGICLGGDPTGTLTPVKNRTILSTFINVHVHGFAEANYVMGNSSSQNSWLGGAITNAVGDGIRLINSIPIENASFFNTQILNNKGYGLNAANANVSDFYFYGVSMDYNRIGAINWGNGTLGIHGGHYEQSNGYIISGVASAFKSIIQIDGGRFALTDATSTDPAFIYVGGTNSQVTIGGGLGLYWGPGHTVNEFINWQSAGTGNVLELGHYTSTKSLVPTTLIPTQASPNLQFETFPEYASGAETDRFWGELRVHDLKVSESPSPRGVTGGAIAYEDGALHQEKINYNDTGFFPLPLTGNSAGAHSDSGFFQTSSARGCTTAASIGGQCASPIRITWPVAFADTNYKVVCSPSGAVTNLPGAPIIIAKATESITVNYFAITAAPASWGTISCDATHD